MISRNQEIVLSVVRALWGEVWPSYRAVLCKVYGPDAFDIEVFVDGEISEEMKESVSCIETEVLADFPPGVAVGSRLVRLDAPRPIEVGDAQLIFLRREV